MRTISRPHLIALALLLVYGVLAARGLTLSAVLYWVFLLIYAGLVFGTYRGSKECARLSAAPPVLVISLTVPNVAYNFYSFFSGHQIYQDSPGTILVVGVAALCLTVPAAVLIGVYWVKRKEVFVAA